jgi:hypothetical protein
VVEEQNPDGFPSHAWDQSPFDRFLCHQTHGPAGAALGWVATYHGDNALLLSLIEHGRRTRALLFVERRFQASVSVTMAHFANRLWSEWEHVGNLRSAATFSQLQQR